jgi:hypothetical protein
MVLKMQTKAIEIFGGSPRFQRTYLWELMLPDDVYAGVSGYDIGKFCQDVKFGDYNMQEVSSIRYGAFRKGYAGFFDIESLIAVFLVPVPNLVAEYFLAWKKLIVSDQGFFYPKNNYAKTIRYIMYDTNGQESYRLKLQGVFPKTFPAYDVSYMREEIAKYIIEFNVDKVTRE